MTTSGDYSRDDQTDEHTSERIPLPRNLPPVPGLHDPLSLADVVSPDRAEVVRQRIVERVTQIHDESRGSAEARVRLFSEEIALASAWVTMMEEHRDAAAADLRDRGVPMTRIARLARVSDSYLARRLFRRGVTRKVVRGGLLAIALGTGAASVVSAVTAPDSPVLVALGGSP